MNANLTLLVFIFFIFSNSCVQQIERQNDLQADYIPNENIYDEFYKDLIAFYPFNGNANDESGYQNHGKVFGATLTQDRNQIENKAYYFDGIDDYIIANSIIKDLKKFTISFWINIESYSGGNYISPFNQFEAKYPYSENPFSIYTGPGNYLGIEGYWGDVTHLDSRTDNIMNTNTWYLYTITYDSYFIRQYINTTLINQVTYANKIIGNNYSAVIGMGYGFPNYQFVNVFFNGKIDDIRIYKRALSKHEIKKIYQTLY